MNKPKVIKDYEKLSEEIDKSLIRFKNKEGKFISALPFETEDHYYLVRMTPIQAQEIIEEDDDYDEDGNLYDEAKEQLENMY